MCLCAFEIVEVVVIVAIVVVVVEYGKKERIFGKGYIGGQKMCYRNRMRGKREAVRRLTALTCMLCCVYVRDARSLTH